MGVAFRNWIAGQLQVLADFIRVDPRSLQARKDLEREYKEAFKDIGGDWEGDDPLVLVVSSNEELRRSIQRKTEQAERRIEHERWKQMQRIGEDGKGWGDRFLARMALQNEYTATYDKLYPDAKRLPLFRRGSALANSTTASLRQSLEGLKTRLERHQAEVRRAEESDAPE